MPGIYVRTYLVELKSVVPYSQSRMHSDPKLEGERPDAHDARTWRSKCHTNEAGDVIIPGMAIKFALMAAAKYEGERIVGRGNKTWGGKFKSGVHVYDDLNLGVSAKDVECVVINAHANGQRTCGTRVSRRFPIIQSWSGSVKIHVLDPSVTEEKLEEYLRLAGHLIGIGRFRPENGGVLGRFEVASIEEISE